jgi:colanic acid biosynthesis glycosyl transferase WcaI
VSPEYAAKWTGRHTHLPSDDAGERDTTLVVARRLDAPYRHDNQPLARANRPLARAGRLATSLSRVPHRAVRVVIFGINYAPEPTGIAPYTTGLAMGLTKRGHEVLVLTGQPHYPYWTRDKSSSRFRSEEQIDGVRVRRLKHRVPRRLSWIGRAAMELTFGLQLLTTGWGRPEVVICVTPPLLATAMSAIRARLTWRRPAMGILVQDLYSRGVLETGAASGLPARAVRLVESLAFRQCDGVAVIHTGFTRDLTEHLGVDVRRIREIRNWTHVSPPDPLASAAFRDAHGWRADEVVILHAGNMGYKQGLENVVAAAALAARTNTHARFVLLGDGNQRASLEAAAAGVSALQFLSPVNEEEFPAALGAADVLLVNERPGVAQMSVPSKLTSYFTSGKPILAATAATGFTAGELAASGAGVCVPADRPELLLSEAIRLGRDRELARQLGDAGRRYCGELLSQDAALDRYEKWIVNLASTRRGGYGGRT